MRLARIRVRHFRSILDLSLEFDQLALICGANSCGKSNVLRAIQFALKSEFSNAEIHDSLIASKRDGRGDPRLSIYIDMTFEGCPPALFEEIGVPSATTLKYEFRVTRGGTVTRKLGEKFIEAPALLGKYFSVTYIPAIRDVAGDGLQPFRRLLGEALKETKTASNLSAAAQQIRQIVRDQGVTLFGDGAAIHRLMPALSTVEVDVHDIHLDKLYQSVGVNVSVAGREASIAELGTGHQSALILHMYRMLGNSQVGDSLFLFEEPDNHLHPATIRAIGADLVELSKTAQVIATTHSPILLGHLELNFICPLELNQDRETKARKIDLTSYSARGIRINLNQFGLKVIEPLLAKTVIVFEGETDATVFEELIERRTGATADQLEILLIRAGGKDPVYKLCKLLSALAVPWKAVFDVDASYQEELPYFSQTTGLDIAASVQSLDSLLSLLQATHGRGRRARTVLEMLKKELEQGPPAGKKFAGSPLELLLRSENRLTQQSRAQLMSALQRNDRQEIQTFLTERSIWLWTSDMEGTLLWNEPCLAAAEVFLRTKGHLKGPVQPANRTATIKNKLKDLASEPVELRACVAELDRQGLFKGSELDEAYRFLVNPSIGLKPVD